MAGITPVMRTLAYLKDQGFTCGVVEKWVMNPKLPGGGIRVDFLNIIDLIAVSKEDGIIGYQVCGTDYSSHYKKITQERAKETRDWLEAGGKLVIISWRKIKKVRGKALMVWAPRAVTITLETLDFAYKEVIKNDE